MHDIIVMYHYVREREGWSGISPMPTKSFVQQVEELNKQFEIVLPSEYSKKTNKPKCILSFDDGTKDQYHNAFLNLKRMGIPAYFTVMSGPLVNKVVPIVHLVHVVLSNYSDEEIWKQLSDRFVLNNIENLSSIYSYEKNRLRRFNKYVLNFYLNESQSRHFLEEKVILKYGNMEKFIDEFYISRDEFIDMNNSGMTIGVHCVNHRPFDGDPGEFYRQEIKPCEQFMSHELGISPEWYTPAFGGGEKYREMLSGLEPVLREKGYKGGFTTIHGSNNGLSEFWLNRIDCNKINL